jgi:hypothetical protein
LFFCFSSHFSFIARKAVVTNLAFPEKESNHVKAG